MIRGSCACGGVRFEIEAVRSMTHCHCATCRKLSGASFATYAHVEKAKFHWVAGQELVETYESAPGSLRSFCRRCSARVPGAVPYLETMSVPAGLLDDDPGVKPRLHVFTSSKAPWWTIDDGLPQHAKWVPGFEPKASTV